jgi:predicted transposase YbfD/YdcC
MAGLVQSATAFVPRMRQHWDMENTLHWSLDVTFHADRSRIRQEHAAEKMAAVRPVALNLLRQDHAHQISLRQQRLFCGLDENDLLMVLSRAT